MVACLNHPRLFNIKSRPGSLRITLKSPEVINLPFGRDIFVFKKNRIILYYVDLLLKLRSINASKSHASQPPLVERVVDQGKTAPA